MASRDSETCLTYNWIQEGIFEKLLLLCKRQEFFKLFRIIAPPGVDLGGEGQFKALSSSFTLRYIDTWL